MSVFFAIHDGKRKSEVRRRQVEILELMPFGKPERSHNPGFLSRIYGHRKDSKDETSEEDKELCCNPLLGCKDACFFRLGFCMPTD